MVSAFTYDPLIIPFLESQERKTPFDKLFTYAAKYMGHSSCRQVNSLLLPLTNMPITKMPITNLRSLRLGTISWCLLEQLQESSRVDQMIEICKSLRIFEVTLNTRSRYRDWDPDFCKTERRAAARKDILRRLLGSMNKLETLAIGFIGPSTVKRFFPVALGELVPGVCAGITSSSSPSPSSRPRGMK